VIRMRPAQASDADYLFDWRNDERTMAMSRSTAPVSAEEHSRWMMMNVTQGYPQHLVMIAESDHHRVGVVRFDTDKRDLMAFDVSITIAPQHRGQGFSLDVLREACSYMSEFTLKAEVRQENTASRKLFERCEFEEVGRGGGYLQFRKEPVR
jgi:RimJ/RimL family protein N-acetyltransferase